MYNEGGVNMALINCPDCKTKVSEHAKDCPSCGYPIAEYVKERNERKQRI